ncbi:hypothetical protein HPP92_015041 [Vanilla planifolia]|uniref:Uncharacterized protein n=1 Tax=Vanilla planifolia TaxID=51239 RepID=A0A835URN5_VANPL|nr:hypothetical protein HPP92_015041 [Vanilla planifolia]
MANLKVLNKELYRKGTCREEEGSREEGEKTGEGQLEDRPTTLCFQDTCPSTVSLSYSSFRKLARPTKRLVMVGYGEEMENSQGAPVS